MSADETIGRAGYGSTVCGVVVVEVLFWVALAGLVWTQALYSLFAAALARLRPVPVGKGDARPTAPVTIIVAAHDEEAVIERRLENLLAQRYPPELVDIVVASDGSTDRTDELVATIAAGEPRVTLLRCPRAGKVAAQNRAVRASGGEVIAFTDANARWEDDALGELVANFADPAVGYVCGRLRLERADGTNREGVYWRYELWQRASESAMGSITAGNGGIYAVRRSDYIETADEIGHDLGLPYRMAQRGRRAVYDARAVAWEKPSRDTEDEYARKVRMHAQIWRHLLSGDMLRGGGPLYLLEIVSHRVLRYASGLLHIVLLICSVVLAGDGLVYAVALGAQLALLVLALLGRLRLPVPGAALALYYVAVTGSTLAGLVHYLRVGVPVVWEKAQGTR
jgi:cellulose synthase/poly-beta-1,6-N-acetylglucosamine synthase-like glycosyltransferase